MGNERDRIIAIDVGTVRIGVAVSDPTGMFAQGLRVLAAAGNWMDELAAIASEYGTKKILAGIPRRTDGADGPEAASVRRVIARLRERIPDAEIIEWDERFTTVIATSVLLEADVSRADRKKSVDKVAAAVMLQSYLDATAPDSGSRETVGIEARNFPAPTKIERRGRRRGRE